MINDGTFHSLESEVRSYCRSFPAVFKCALGSYVEDEDGRQFIDFLAGAGSLNYGHNNPHIRQAVVDYLGAEGILHSLDLYTVAKRNFLEAFSGIVLSKRGLDYRVQFPGPTGTNAVEAALKIARKVTGRSTVAAFTNGFHGMSLGALAATGNASKRKGAGVSLDHITRLPFDGYFGRNIDTIGLAERLLDDPGSGVDLPAAFIVETIQGEGGLNIASAEWLRRLAGLAVRIDALLIVDDIQAGCGRTGTFFSFENAGIVPDVVCLSKSIGGIGLPLSLVLIKPRYDQWLPGEHNGTFRGHNLAFVAGTAALDFWRDDTLSETVRSKSVTIVSWLNAIVDRYLDGKVEVRGRGLMVGIAMEDQPDLASKVSAAAFARGLIVETCGPRNEVLKLLPPLTIEFDTLRKGLNLLEAAFAEVVGSQKRTGQVVVTGTAA
jgi:diaminobutyrate-2-oxoglutarate transaminase